MWDRQVWPQLLQLKGLVWYSSWGSLDLPPAAFLLEVGSAGVLKGGDNLVDGAAPCLTVSSKWSMWQVLRAFLRESLKCFFGALCHGSQWRVHHTELSWAGAGPPFWRHALLSFAVTSATWPLCWWFQPDQGPQHWRSSYSRQCWGWCKDSADGSAEGSIDSGGRLTMTQSHTAGWWVWQLDRHWYSCSSSDACCSMLFCRICQKHSLPWPVTCLFPCWSWHLMWWYTPDKWTDELLSGMVMWGGRYSSWSADCWRTSVFFKLTPSPKSWAASAKQEVRCCWVL